MPVREVIALTESEVVPTLMGWRINRRMTSGLVEDALTTAIGRRCTEAGLIYHSDRGSRYASDMICGMLLYARKRGLWKQCSSRKLLRQPED